MIGFIDTLFTQLGTTGNYSAVAVLHTSRYTVAHTHTHSHTKILRFHKSYPGNGFISLTVTSNNTQSVLFTAQFLSCHYSATDNSIPQIPSSYPGRLASRNSNQFISTELFLITTLYEPRRKHKLSIAGKACLQRRCIATEVTRVFVAAGMCLRSRCLAMNVYSDFIIPVSGVVYTQLLRLYVIICTIGVQPQLKPCKTKLC
jgi:hypothetical protein